MLTLGWCVTGAGRGHSESVGLKTHTCEKGVRLRNIFFSNHEGLYFLHWQLLMYFGATLEQVSREANGH